MTAGSVHIAKDTIYGREALCGREAMFAVYANEVADVPDEDICAECSRLLADLPASPSLRQKRFHVQHRLPLR